MNGSVTALLVSHDGGRWLPEVLDSLSRQTVPPSAVVAVDTGSRDGSVALLRSALPDGTVLETDRDTRYPAAVRAGLGALGPAGDDDWVWLLHDDSAPAPDALERLLAARATHSAAGGPDVLGPKIREWPSLRRILEVGVTITGTAQRETGLERGEYDQGQHDEPRDVLAVNTAGMLVRRTVLERLGLDDELPVIHTDLDFGWRAARAGLRVRTVPDAVVFHAEASRTGTREPDLDRAARRRRERGAALYTVLVNCATAAMPFIALRLLAGAVLRALGLLLVRAPGEAWAELRAAAATLLRPGRLVRARRARHAVLRGRVPGRPAPAGPSVAALPPRPRRAGRDRCGRGRRGRRPHRYGGRQTVGVAAAGPQPVLVAAGLPDGDQPRRRPRHPRRGPAGRRSAAPCPGLRRRLVAHLPEHHARRGHGLVDDRPGVPVAAGDRGHGAARQRVGGRRPARARCGAARRARRLPVPAAVHGLDDRVGVGRRQLRSAPRHQRCRDPRTGRHPGGRCRAALAGRVGSRPRLGLG